MSVTVILIAVGVDGTVSQGLERRLEEFEIRGKVETIQTTAFLRSARINRTILTRKKLNNDNDITHKMFTVRVSQSVCVCVCARARACACVCARVCVLKRKPCRRCHVGARLRLAGFGRII